MQVMVVEAVPTIPVVGRLVGERPRAGARSAAHPSSGAHLVDRRFDEWPNLTVDTNDP